MSARELYHDLKALVNRGISNELAGRRGAVPATEGEIELFKTEGGWCCKVYTQLLSSISDEHIFLADTEESVLEKALQYFTILVDISEDNFYSEMYGEFND